MDVIIFLPALGATHLAHLIVFNSFVCSDRDSATCSHYTVRPHCYTAAESFSICNTHSDTVHPPCTYPNDNKPSATLIGSYVPYERQLNMDICLIGIPNSSHIIIIHYLNYYTNYCTYIKFIKFTH